MTKPMTDARKPARTPYRAELDAMMPSGDQWVVWYDTGHFRSIIAKVNANLIHEQTAEIVATNIAAALNAHDELVAALRSVCGVFEGLDDVPIYVQKARAALARATEGE